MATREVAICFSEVVIPVAAAIENAYPRGGVGASVFGSVPRPSPARSVEVFLEALGLLRGAQLGESLGFDLTNALTRHA